MPALKLSAIRHPLNALVLLAVLPLSSLTAEPTPQPGLSQDQKQHHEILEDIDRELQDRLECHALNRARGLPPITDPQQESETFLGRLRSLEATLETAEGERANALQNAVRALMNQARNLGQVVDLPADSSATRVVSPGIAGAEWLGGTGVPTNDTCEAALPITAGNYVGDTTFATSDGNTTCDLFRSSPDVWFRFTFPTEARINANTFGSEFDTVLSVHSGCPGTRENTLNCNDNSTGLQSNIGFNVEPGVEYWIRVSGFADSAGRYNLNIGPRGGIAGKVTDAATGAPVPFAEIAVTPDETSYTRYDVASVAGEYLVEGLEAGTYYVHIRDAFTYQSELYNGLPCPAGNCEPKTGTPVQVGLSAITNDIDFALQPGGTIAGVVTNSETGEPIPHAIVVVADLAGNTVGQSETNYQGKYQVVGLASGFYVAYTKFTSARDEIYDGTPCPGGPDTGCTFSDGTPITVTGPAVTSGINFALEPFASISGTVSDHATGQPLSFIQVTAYGVGGLFVTSEYTDSSGHYRLGGLPVGDYFLRTEAYSGYQDEIYDDLPCVSGSCDVTLGTPVASTLDDATSGIDFALDRLGQITGQVNYEIGGQAIRSARLRALDANGYVRRSATTGLDGSYELERLPTGDYYVYTENPDLIDKLYDDLPWVPGVTDPTMGTPIAAELGTRTPNINFALLRGGAITGTVTDSDGPIRFVNVEVSDSEGRELANVRTNSDGAYQALGLPTGDYFVTMLARQHIDERYPNVPCEDSACPLDSGTSVPVTVGETVENINVQLQVSAGISGTVTHARTGEPLGINVLVVGADGSVAGNDYTNNAGQFTIEDLAPGTYFARTDASFAYIDKIYDDLPCPDAACVPTAGTPIVTVAETTTEGINFSLEELPGGRLSGLVTHAYTGASTYAQISIWNQDGERISPAYGDSAGRYVSERLPAGTYFVVAEARSFEPQLYDGRPCPGGPPTGCDPTTGTPVVITEDGLTSGVDFTLRPEGATCGASDTALCLSNGRFRVEITWQDINGNTGAGKAQGMTDDTGYFWFFNDDNVEIVIKVLDACGGGFDRFWVFAGGLTNVETTLTVTDTLTGEVRSYSNPQGVAFEPILDTDAFATCHIAADQPARAVPAPAHSEQSLLPSKSLGLDGGRFVVEAFWSTAGGTRTAASAELMTNDTGYFWFFDEDNVEIVVKVLNACDLAPFNNYWVYAAGLTDVEVTLVVTDTLTGEQQFYFNTLGSPFQPVQHTGAFDTCP